MKFVITIFLIHKFFDIATAEDTNSSLSGSNTSIIVAVAAIVGIFVIGTLSYCLCCRRKKGKKKKVGPREVKESKKSKPRGGGASATSSTSKVNIPREGDRLIPSPDVRLTLTTNPISLIQPSGTTTPSKAPPQTPLTPPQPQHSAIPSSTQTTLARVTESLLEERKASSEIVVTPEVSEEFTSRPRPHSTIEQRDNLPQSRSSSDLSSRFSLPPTAQTYGQHSETRDFYPQGTTSVESHLEQVTRSRDTSPFRHQYHEYGTQTFDTPIDPRLQTQSRGLDSQLFPDPNLPSSQQSFETSTGDVLQEIGQRQRAPPIPPYPAPPPYDEPNIPTTPPERRGRPESTYSFDDNPGSTVPERPIQRSTPGTSPRSRRGRRGGNR